MRDAEAYRRAADEALNQAKHLAGQETMPEWEFLQSMATADELIDHDVEVCGMCYHRHVMAEVARELIAAGQFADATQLWAEEERRRWEESKFFKLWQAETAAGRDPHQAFAERGWEP